MRVGMLIHFLVCVHSLYAQQYFFSRYTPKNGLVNNRARSIYQDSKGRLYICTYGGLSVYDGSRFTNYTTEDGLVTSLVNEIVEMGDDSLWVIPNGHDLHCLVHGLFRNVQMADHFYPVINHIIHGSNGDYYGLCDEGLYRLNKEHTPGHPSARLRWSRIILPDSTGTDIGRNILEGVEWHRQLFLICQPFPFTRSALPSLIIYNLDTRKCIVAGNTRLYTFAAHAPNGDLLLATSEGVRKIDEAALSHNILHLQSPSPPYEEAGNIGSGYLYFDKDAGLWLVPAHKVIRIGKDGSRQEFSEASGLPAGETNAVLQDKENNIWLTNEQNGIVKLVSPHVQFYSQPQPGFTVTDISARSGSDSVWFYDANRRTLLLQTGNIKKTFQGVGTLPLAGHILIARKAYLIGSKDIYTIRFLPGQQFQVSPFFHDTTVMDGNGYFTPDGNVMIASTKLTYLINGRIEQYPVSSYVDQAAIDGDHRLWTITRGNELSVYTIDDSGKGPSLQLLKKFNDRLPGISPRSLAVDGEGHVWIGSRDHGLFCLFFNDLTPVSYKQITIADGLSENFVNYLHCDADNTIWACTPTGLNKIRLRAGHFSIEDVAPSNDTYQHIDKVLSSAGGVHWALTREGFMKIDTSDDSKGGYWPQILFSRVLVGDNPISNPPGTTLFLPYDRNTLSFFIGTPAFTDEGRTRYTWLLEGSRDPQWSAPSIQSAINFVNLPPGRYTLRVRAQFLTGRYPEQTASYTFFIHPPWWQTWWFRAALAFVLTAIIALAVRSYIRRRLEIQRIALEKKQAIEKERTRIATDMHDDLGAGLSRIKFLSETIGIKKQQQLPIEEEITSIREYSHEMIDKMGEIVWALNEKNDSLSDLLSYTRSYAVEYLLQAGIRCTVETPDNFPALFVSGEFRRNIFLTIKETLHNIVKHSQAGCVRFSMDTDRELIIIIQDDGIGFDRGQIRPFSNGLANMQRRIRDIGGRLLIHPGGDGRTGRGTLVKIIAPL
ncbi:MAG TPA: two-component regulator propeller domain-containing protein [Puia sp.]|nr:two-component regulator propeller domain-containing protein [Puia sp.]